MEESFTYDGMDRLTGITLTRRTWQDLHCSVSYDALGRMTSRQAVTAVNGTPSVETLFSTPSFDATKVHAMTQAQASPSFPSEGMEVTYTGFDKVSRVRQGGDSLRYTYGFDRERIRMEEFRPEETRTKDYVGSCEFITKTTLGESTTRSLTFVSGPCGVFAVVEREGGAERTHYVHKDHLGSWTVITDEDGVVEQTLSYDAWGCLRDPATWANHSAPGDFEPMFGRGFTGHEHLSRFGLVNMDGRMYDPFTASFLSADRFVQDPSSAQGFNRYAYCLHNPLRYVDPTGYYVTYSGHHPDDPPRQVVIDGQAYFVLPETTITPYEDPPTTTDWTEFSYKPYYSGGNGGGPQWGSSDVGPILKPSGGSGSGGGHRSKTNQYRVKKIGYLPLDVDSGKGYAATQVANYTMLYNVTTYHLPNSQIITDYEDNFYLSVSGLSSNTLVIGDVYASAKATLYINDSCIDSQPFVINPNIAVLNPLNTTYLGSVSFAISTSENVVLKIQGGWNVYFGAGWVVPTRTIFGPPIDANMTIQINP